MILRLKLAQNCIDWLRYYGPGIEKRPYCPDSLLVLTRAGYSGAKQIDLEVNRAGIIAPKGYQSMHFNDRREAIGIIEELTAAIEFAPGLEIRVKVKSYGFEPTYIDCDNMFGRLSSTVNFIECEDITGIGLELLLTEN